MKTNVHLMDDFQMKAAALYIVHEGPEPPHQIMVVEYDDQDIAQYRCWCDFVALDPHDSHFTQKSNGYHFPLRDQ